MLAAIASLLRGPVAMTTSPSGISAASAETSSIFFRYIAGEARPVHRERAARGHAVYIRALHYERAHRAHLGLEQTHRVCQLVAAQ